MGLGCDGGVDGLGLGWSVVAGGTVVSLAGAVVVVVGSGAPDVIEVGASMVAPIPVLQPVATNSTSIKCRPRRR